MSYTLARELKLGTITIAIKNRPHLFHANEEMRAGETEIYNEDCVNLSESVCICNIFNV